MSVRWGTDWKGGKVSVLSQRLRIVSNKSMVEKCA